MLGWGPQFSRPSHQVSYVALRLKPGVRFQIRFLLGVSRGQETARVIMKLLLSFSLHATHARVARVGKRQGRLASRGTGENATHVPWAFSLL